MPQQAPIYPTRFKMIIEQREASYSALAAVTGLTRQSLCNYANGIRKPDISTACLIIRTLNLNINDIETLFEPVYY